MYNVVVKKVHVRYLISWWVSCYSLEGSEFHRCGPTAAKHWSPKVLCECVEKHTLLCWSSGVDACGRRRRADSHLPDMSVHCQIDTGIPGQRAWIGVVVTQAFVLFVGCRNNERVEEKSGGKVCPYITVELSPEWVMLLTILIPTTPSVCRNSLPNAEVLPTPVMSVLCAACYREERSIWEHHRHLPGSQSAAAAEQRHNGILDTALAEVCFY